MISTLDSPRFPLPLKLFLESARKRRKRRRGRDPTTKRRINIRSDNLEFPTGKKNQHFHFQQGRKKFGKKRDWAKIGPSFFFFTNISFSNLYFSSPQKKFLGGKEEEGHGSSSPFLGWYLGASSSSSCWCQKSETKISFLYLFRGFGMGKCILLAPE